MLGWLLALNSAGMQVSSDRTVGIRGSELGDEILFQTTVCFKADKPAPLEKQYIYVVWRTPAIQRPDLSATEYQGSEAEVRFKDLAGEMLRQITYRDTTSAVTGIIGLWKCIGRDDNTLLVFNRVGDKSFLYLYGADRLYELLAMLQTHKRDTISRGFTADEE